ncbi:hypothetical protein K493DRAFT_339914 [Basidiobolus meristosporus CBS 931.73]|uniref:Arrestin C-terminal-like domain-containing protein n=1 Tax=Basidiobolus meristosporus CBS 931.73 TaxID=1314790 RepID=A0A1Y1XXS1_9FUNG|nr:hypothetical protein K493DRAFT_339914 [Basidiobolus meristosporus CBS 931.73]|eukprot:ORX90550.1 hypothetical protein K493DRAFT_339914 [Basidiobolus meristosporus CBS 931.73]
MHSTLRILLQDDALFTNTFSADDASSMALRGSIILSTSTILKVKKLSLQFHGRLSMQFPAAIKKTRRDLVYQTVILFDHEKPIPFTGQHTVPFELLLPCDLPESFQGEFGKVKYTLKAVAETSFINVNLKSEVAVPVLRNPDWKYDPKYEYIVEDIAQGKLACNVTLPKSGYNPGEKFDIKVSTLPLRAGLCLSNITCTLYEYTEFYIPAKNDQTVVSAADFLKRLDIMSKSMRILEYGKIIPMAVPEDASCSCSNYNVVIHHRLDVRISYKTIEEGESSITVKIPISVVSPIIAPEAEQLPKYHAIKQPPSYYASSSTLSDETMPSMPPTSYSPDYL